MVRKPSYPTLSIYFSVIQENETYRSLYSKHRLVDHVWSDHGAGLLNITLRLITLSDSPAETDVSAYLLGAEPIVILHELSD